MFVTVLYQMIALFILIILGVFLYKKELMDDYTATKISTLITFVFNPMMMITSAFAGLGSVDKKEWFRVFGIAMAIFLILILLSFVVAPIFDRRKWQKEMFQLMFAFGNLGFMGIPVINGVYGPEYGPYILPFLVGFNIYFYTFGLALMNGKLDKAGIKRMINPGSIGSIVAIALVIWNPPLPSFAVSAITYLGQVTSPLAMLLVGVAVAKADIKQIFTSKKMYLFTFIRMVVVPLIAIPILRIVLTDPTIRGICLIEIAMPVGNLCLAVGMEKGIDCSNCSAGIIMTTLLSVLTLPIIVTLL